MNNTLGELIWKMECKGFDAVDIHFYITVIWLIDVFPFVNCPWINYENHRKVYLSMQQSRIDQAHIEIDFTNFKK